MSTDTFFKKVISNFAAAVLLLFCMLSCTYAGVVASAQSVEVNGRFYFLVTDDTKVEVGAEFAKLEGGAGYLIEHDGREYVTLAVYLDEEEGLAVQSNLKKAGKTTSLLQKSVSTLYFKGREKKQHTFLVGGLNTLKSYVCVLRNVIDYLAEGLSQEGCKSLLKTLVRQYQHAKEYYREYEELSETFDKSAQQLFTYLDGVVYLKDLRYLLCWQAEKYIALCGEFSL